MDRVEGLVLLAVAAGCGSIQTDDGERYPVIVRENRQLLFRDHPFLRVIAASKIILSLTTLRRLPLQAIAEARDTGIDP